MEGREHSKRRDIVDQLLHGDAATDAVDMASREGEQIISEQDVLNRADLNVFEEELGDDAAGDVTDRFLAGDMSADAAADALRSKKRAT